MVSRAISRGEVYWVNLDSTIGSEIQKTRPALVVSPDDLNAALPRVIIAPITTTGQPMGCRPEAVFQNKAARILLDQIRCVDKARLGKKWGGLTKPPGMVSCWKCWLKFDRHHFGTQSH